MDQKQYRIAPRGLATQFSEAEVPVDYASEFRNRFINGSGDAEKRPGMIQIGNNIPGNSVITGLHEFVGRNTETKLIATASGQFFEYDENTEIWSKMDHEMAFGGVLRSVTFDDKLIFYNGEEQSVFTSDGINFTPLEALIEVGVMGTGTSGGGFIDSQISAWATQTNVAVNDLVFNVTLSSWAIITNISGNSLVTTVMGSTTQGIGNAIRFMAVGDRYQIIDSIELNIFRTDDPNVDDNIVVSNTGTNEFAVVTSAITDWTKSEIRVGDWYYNTTRNTLARVVEIYTDYIIGTRVVNQVPGDSLTFLKNASPHMSFATIHFGRLYAVDSRDKRKIRISGTNNPRDWTADAGQLDISRFEGSDSRINTFNAGAIQPEGDIIQTLTTFQTLLVIGGRSNTYLYSGTVPFDSFNPDGSSNADADFRPAGVFPQGCVAPDAMVNLGNDVAWLSDDGVQTVAFQDLGTIKTDPTSNQINNTLRQLTKTTKPEDIKAFTHGTRNWMMLKIGSEMYVYSFAPITLAVGNRRGQVLPSWYLFDGRLAQSASFLSRQNGALIIGGNGRVYQFDTGNYSDAGQIYRTDYKTGWLSFDEPRRSTMTKSLKFIEPIMESGTTITYTISVEGDSRRISGDEIVVSAVGQGAAIGSFLIGTNAIGGSRIFQEKFDFNAFGRSFRFRFITEDDKGPDILGRFELYYNAFPPE